MAVKFLILFTALVASTFAVPATEELQHDGNSFVTGSVRSSRIVGGTQAGTGSHPHMVALTTGTIFRSFICGGTLLTQRSVLTAAHCIESVVNRRGNLDSSLRGVIGTNRWRSGTTISFSRNITHAEYDSSTIKNNIGLLITSQSVAFSPIANAIPMNLDFVGANVPVRMAGWGATRFDGSMSANLLELSMVTIPGEQCKWEVPVAAAAVNMIAPEVDPELEICAFHSLGHGMCRGDTGSAVILQSSRQIVGLVSWGVPCAVGGPDVFVRLSAYQTWLFWNLVS